MKAEDFIKKFGIEKAKEFCQITIKGLDQRFNFDDGRCANGSANIEYVDLHDLKRIVASLDLIQSRGGLKTAKFLIQSANKLSFHLEQQKLPVDDDVQKDILRLEQAIVDFESCQ